MSEKNERGTSEKRQPESLQALARKVINLNVECLSQVHELPVSLIKYVLEWHDTDFVEFLLCCEVMKHEDYEDLSKLWILEIDLDELFKWKV